MNSSNERGFKELEFPPVIETSSADFLEEFYIPLLSRANEYKRGVGYFTSNWIESAARGMVKLAERGGTAKWLSSPQLNASDWEALQKAERAQRDEVLAEVLKQKVENLEKALKEDTRNAIAWMIYDGVLELRFAVPEQSLSGDFHDKWGIFLDDFGTRVAFHGSQNDSQRSFENYESYDVFCDWMDDRELDRVTRHEERFDNLWADKNEAVSIHTLPEAVSERLIQLRDTDRPYDQTSSKEKQLQPDDEAESDGISLWDFQETAVEAWFRNECRGMFEMATGTGKTYTAIGGLQRLFDRQNGPIAVVIAVPYTHLANQWADSLVKWGFNDVRFTFGSLNPEWKKTLTQTVGDLNIGVRNFAIFITTHRTLADDYFREKIQQLNCRSLLIGDEVHGMGSPKHRQGLIDSYDYRLGLSATPERFYDEAGTRRLFEFFGDVIYEHGLADAIPEYLTEYEYYPRLVELTAEELDEYRGYSSALAAEMNKESPDEERVERLMNKRADIIKNAENKFRDLQNLLGSLSEIDHLLVYTNHAQIDDVQNILNKHGIVQHKFTFQENENERKSLLAGFDVGQYDALVAMRCLDEGVDVPSTRQAILMSNSRNPKQFIQRRGRVLRKAEGKDIARIYDMIVVPSLNPSREIIESERSILARELERFEEFAATARNEAEARNTIQRLKRLYEL